MQVAVLGEVEVRDGDRVVEIAGIRLRVLIGRLAMDAGQSVPTSVLIDCVWGRVGRWVAGAAVDC